MNSLKIKIKDQTKFEALFAFLKSLDFVTIEENESNYYDSKFVQKIEESKNQIEKGEFEKLDVLNIDKLLGLDNG